MANTSALKLVPASDRIGDTMERIGVTVENARCVLDLVRHYLESYREQFSGISGITIEGCLYSIDSSLEQIDKLADQAHDMTNSGRN